MALSLKGRENSKIIENIEKLPSNHHKKFSYMKCHDSIDKWILLSKSVNQNLMNQRQRCDIYITDCNELQATKSM